MQNAPKPCFGHGCLLCKKKIQCQSGVYEGVIEVKEDFIECLKCGAAKRVGDLQEAFAQERQFPV
tara:strand:- start:322 stop:516 length:195 start_codon:yes stop_codon:yes gene_type:complete